MNGYKMAFFSSNYNCEKQFFDFTAGLHRGLFGGIILSDEGMI
jgi:hypothetical protein